MKNNEGKHYLAITETKSVNGGKISTKHARLVMETDSMRTLSGSK